MHKNTLSYILFFIGTAFILAALVMMGGLELNEIEGITETNFYLMIFSIINSIIGTGIIITGAILYTPEMYYPKEEIKKIETKEKQEENN